MKYLAPDKLHLRVFVNTIMNLLCFIKAGNFFADSATGALRTSFGICPIGYLTLKFEPTLQSQNIGEETSRDGAKYSSSRGIRRYISVMATLKFIFFFS
jgi:hypothetical protein